VNFKEFAYRTSLSVMSKSSLNFGNLISSSLSYSIDINPGNLDISDIMSHPSMKKERDSQMERLQKNNTIRVAIVENKAYFVHENTFYTALLVDGEVDRSSASPINAFDIDKKEMKLLLSILDNMNN
jgi:hypothetical protein